ncbi:hypothetical protein K501DRAFT_312881 [Backusella circina FSU 941]|nr:hypothetical protein K501DRAFT_312881 [Backusella circina FSU 941]
MQMHREWQVCPIVLVASITKTTMRAQKTIPPTSYQRHSSMRKMYDPNREIPTPKRDISVKSKPRTQEQINELIGCLVNDKMTLSAASANGRISQKMSKRYYYQFQNDPNYEMSILKEKKGAPSTRCTEEQIKKLISYIVEDRISVETASMKAEVSDETGRRYYCQCLDDLNHKIPIPTRYDCTKDQIKILISYVVNDKISVPKAAERAKMCRKTALRYYTQYKTQK